MEHINDIDSIWKITEKNKTSIIDMEEEVNNHNNAIFSIQGKQEEFFNVINENKLESQKNIEILKSKLKITYISMAILAGIEIIHIVASILN